MTEEITVDDTDIQFGLRPRPIRLALMGEFSAGKSTLSKLFLGGAPLPVRVTATRLPPVWISYGEDAAIAVSHDGTERVIDLNDLEAVSVEETRLIRLYNRSETLEICDLIDMPGISDPSMSSDVWLSVIDQVDSVVWCTQATQAWRQSEAAAWEKISGRINGDNILLVTQVDKLQNARDVDRVMARVRKETDGLFKAVYPLSIIQAIDAGEDETKWRDSGAAAFVDYLVESLLNAPHVTEDSPENSEDPIAAREVPAHPARPASQMEKDLMPDDTPPAVPVSYSATSVIPKRVRVLTEMRGRTARPAPAYPAIF